MKTIFVVTTVFIFLISLNSVFSQITDDSYFQQGLNSLKNSDTSAALIQFNKSIDEYDNPNSYYYIALILKNAKKSEIILKAKYYFKDAIEREPSNVEFRYQYALYLEYLDKIERADVFSLKQAINQYNEIIKINPNYSPAYYRLGLLKYKDFIDFNQSSRKTNQTGILKYGNYSLLDRASIEKQQSDDEFNYRISYNEIAKEDFYKSEKYLLQAIDTDPNNYDAYKTLSLLYEDADENEKGLKIISKVINYQPDNYNSYLISGILNYKLNDNEGAYKSFRKALSLMPPEERKDFMYNTVRILLSALIEEQKTTLTDEMLNGMINNYWINKDPLLLTEFNERLLEHYVRVAYSNIRFTTNNNKIKGWQTDRGEALIRYGFPLKRIKLRHSTDSSFPTNVPKPLQIIYVKTEIWFYNDFTLGFTDQFLTNEFKFNVLDLGNSFATQFSEDTDLIVKQGLRKTKPEDYIPKFKGPLFDLPYSTTQFRNESNHTMTDIVVSFQLQVPDKDAKYSINKQFITGLFYHDQNFRPTYSQRDTINLVKDNSKVCSSTIKTQPEVGNLALEVIRKSDEGVASYHGKLKIKDYGNNNLNVSEILLATLIEPGNKKTGLIRNEISIEPNPSKQFQKYDPLYIYYEVYNLELGIDRLTDFTQQLTIKKIGNETVLNKFLDVIGIGKGGEKIMLSSNYRTLEKDPQIYFQLDMSNYESGEYEVEIKIIDNTTKRYASTKTKLIWMK